jgi:hypothetical protein
MRLRREKVRLQAFRGIELHILVFDKSKRTGSQWTLRWREMDSNLRFRTREATDLSFRFLSMSLKLSAF